MATATQRRRLIEAIAFIRTHRSKWEQGFWIDPDRTGPCGTVGCLAGHIATTLNAHKPVIDYPAAIFKKPFDARTEEERELISDWQLTAELVRATAADDAHYVEKRTLSNGKTVDVVHVKRRAERLIGDLVHSDAGHLFSGSNKLRDIYRIAAHNLGITTTELLKECDRVALAKGWKK